MALTDPYKVRLGEDVLAILDTVSDAPDYVRAAVRWAHALDLTEATVAELLASRDAMRGVAQVYADPARAIDAIMTDAAIGPVDALHELERAGWDKPCLCAAADILNGTWMVPFFGAGGMRAELFDGEAIALEGELGQSYAAKHGGDPAKLKALTAGLNDAGALLLRQVVIEFWRGHKIVERRLGYGPE